ncbi:MAG: MFS transporter [Synergistaceae bacterium]|jgi:predicted MFS family arabinose efflux permease|nr:MFS transporter [Synergistaceae bacterium]
MVSKINGNRGGFLKPTILATLTLLVSTGIRNTVGLFVDPLVRGTVMSLTDVSMALAIGQFVFGFFQPLGGLLTTKYKTFTVLVSGAACLVAGLLGIKYANSFVALVICFGLLSPAGAAASSFPILMGHISESIPDEKKSISSGLINAGGSAGQFILAPLIQICIKYYGYYGACVFLAGMTILSLLPSWFLCRPGNEVRSKGDIGDARDESTQKGEQKDPRGDLKKEVAVVFRKSSYWILHAGFFACGFHVAFLATHLPGETVFFGYDGSFAALCFSILGICNIAGCVGVGALGKYFELKNILVGLYATRVVSIVIYLAAPKTMLTFILFAAISGSTFGSTVPPTGNIAARLVRPKYLSTLFGLIFVTHQIGSFFGAWLGGFIMDSTGSFTSVWVIDACLSLFAAIISLKISKTREVTTV